MAKYKARNGTQTVPIEQNQVEEYTDRGYIVTAPDGKMYFPRSAAQKAKDENESEIARLRAENAELRRRIAALESDTGGAENAAEGVATASTGKRGRK